MTYSTSRTYDIKALPVAEGGTSGPGGDGWGGTGELIGRTCNSFRPATAGRAADGYGGRPPGRAGGRAGIEGMGVLAS